MQSKNHHRCVLYTLLAVYTFNIVDRQILALLMEPIKQDLQLSDTALGFMSGIAFALFYATLGIPIARLADRSHRVNIIAISLALWSGMTVLTGLVSNFWQLLIARIGVGVGEAGCTPPAHSLIADYFVKTERNRAISIYMMGPPIGIMIGFFVAGWLNELYGWRIAFISLGLPGLIMAVVVKLAVREPAREQSSASSANRQKQYSTLETFLCLWRKRAFRRLVIALALINFVGVGSGQWVPSFFIRNHGMSTGELGMWLSVMTGLSGIIGIYIGNYITQRYARDNESLKLRILAIGTLLMLVTVPLYLFSSHKYSALMLYGLTTLLFFLHYGPCYSMVLNLAQPRMRAMASAVTLLIVNLIGMGLGPQAVGIMADLLVPVFGDDALQWALLFTTAITPLAVWLLWSTGKTAQEDLDESYTDDNDAKVTTPTGAQSAATL